MSTSDPKTPSAVATYIADELGGRTKHQRMLSQFHRWLTTLGRLEQEVFDLAWCEQFHRSCLSQPVTAGALRRAQPHLRRFLRWMAARSNRAIRQPEHPEPLCISQARAATLMPMLPPAALRYLQAKSVTRRASTCQIHRNALRRFHGWAQDNDIQVATIQRDQFLRFSSRMAEDNLAPSTRQVYLGAIHSYLRYLAANQRLDSDLDTLIVTGDLPRRAQTLPRALKPHVDAKLCARLCKSDNPLWRALLVMRNTGLRIGELATLPFDCVQHDAQYPHLIVPPGKLDRERAVPLDPETVELIRWLRRRPPHPRQWLLESRRQKPIDVRVYGRALDDACADLHHEEAEPITSHRLRHSYATSLVAAGLDIAAVKQLLGHRGLSMTMQYVKLTTRDIARQYLAARNKAQERYQLPPTDMHGPQGVTPAEKLEAVTHIIRRDAGELDKNARARALRLARKLHHIAEELRDLGI